MMRRVVQLERESDGRDLEVILGELACVLLVVGLVLSRRV